MEQQYIIPLAIAAFIGFKFYKNYSRKKRIPMLLQSDHVIIDVRTKEEFLGGANPKSINIPLDQFESKVKTLDKNKMIIVCCASGGRSGMALSILRKNGFDKIFNAGPWQNTLE